MLYKLDRDSIRKKYIMAGIFDTVIKNCNKTKPGLSVYLFVLIAVCYNVRKIDT